MQAPSREEASTSSTAGLCFGKLEPCNGGMKIATLMNYTTSKKGLRDLAYTETR